jgi:3-hydroxyacyl-[acyl-carrier-protein] dehydratase
MPPPLLFDLSLIDLQAKPIFDRDAICEVNPQRFEMQHLDGILWCDKDKRLILGYKDVTEDEFWVRGHIPDRPLMPGVIMIEAAAQLSSFFMKQIFEIEGFIGFAGIDSAKFRSVVEPGQRLYLLGHVTKFKLRKRASHVTTKVQGVVEGSMVFEAAISGMKV